MLKDDRMMSMFTFVVIMVAIGTMIQRVDVIDEFFGGGGKVALELRRDEAIVRANTLSAIDVLANDVGLGTRDADNLVIVEQPECGRVFARGGEAQYLPAERCAGAQMFRYAISGRGEQTGEVTVIVRLGDVTQNEVAADAQRDVPTPTPIAPRASEQQTGQSPSLGPEPTQLANSGGETVQAPEVPRPQAPVIGSLTDASSASQVDTASAGVLAHDRPELAPRVAAPGGGLTHGLASTSTPTIPGRLAATQASPAQDGPERAGPQQPGSDQTGPVQAAPSQPEPGQSSSAAPVTEIPLPGTASAATMALARIDPTQPAADAGGGSGATVHQGSDALGGGVSGAAPSAPDSGSTGVGAGQPGDAVASVRALGDTSGLTPVDTSPPPELASPGNQAPPAPETEPAVAARTTAIENCVIPPALTLDVEPAGVTEVMIDSPCHAGTVAELEYEGLRFGVPIAADGSGSIAALGFQIASDATLTFVDDQKISFNIPFNDTEKLDRVALAWDVPLTFELHAFEFGASFDSDGHVSAGNPRSYSEVRRSGGGYLTEFGPVNGVGQSVSIYSFWHRKRGAAGVVRLDVALGTLAAGAASGPCSAATGSEPDFIVLRSVAGRLQRPRLRRLAPFDCATIAGKHNRFIADAVDDMIVRQQ